MKLMIKSIIIAAVVAAAPAHAVFSRLGTKFSPKYVPMYLRKQPSITLGALLGAATVKAVHNNQYNQQAPYNCDSAIALHNVYALLAKENKDHNKHNEELKNCAKAFNYCEKIVASRDEIYNRNIAYALYKANGYYNYATWCKKEGYSKPAESNYLAAARYTKVAEQLKQAQAQERNKK